MHGEIHRRCSATKDEHMKNNAVELEELNKEMLEQSGVKKLNIKKSQIQRNERHNTTAREKKNKKHKRC